jgi:hypothetical protein
MSGEKKRQFQNSYYECWLDKESCPNKGDLEENLTTANNEIFLLGINTILGLHVTP